MSIQTQIDRLRLAKTNLIAEIVAKGVSVPVDASLDDLALLVQAIETGTVGGSVYEGAYDITPSTVTQTLFTADHLMSKNVVVKSIPYREETNVSGGTTIYIACDDVLSEGDATTAELGRAVLGKMKLA